MKYQLLFWHKDIEFSIPARVSGDGDDLDELGEHLAEKLGVTYLWASKQEDES